MRRRRARGGVVALVAVVVFGACTATDGGPDGPSPSPSPSAAATSAAPRQGERIAVIVPPAADVAPAEAAVLARVAREIGEAPPDGVAEVRVTQATTAAFVSDLAELAADDGFDIVCVVGTGTAETALALARSWRNVRVCTTDPRIAGGPVNLVAVGLDPAALVEAGAVAIGTAAAPVGFVASPQLGDVEALTATFTTTVAPPRQQAPPPSPGATTSPNASPTPAPSPAGPPPAAPQQAFVTVAAGAGATAQLNAANDLAAGNPSRALVLVTPGGTEAAPAAAASGAELVAVIDWVVDDEGQQPANLLVGLTVDWGAILVGAIEAARATEGPQVQLLGVDAEVLGAVPGQTPEAVAAADRTNEHLRRSAQPDDG